MEEEAELDTSYATQAALDPSSVLARNENIVYTNLDDTIVMMDVDEGRYFELAPVAARIWMLLEEQQTTQSICDALVEEYDVSFETCQQDTLEFLQTSVGQHLVRVEASYPPPPSTSKRKQTSKEGLGQADHLPS